MTTLILWQGACKWLILLAFCCTFQNTLRLFSKLALGDVYNYILYIERKYVNECDTLIFKKTKTPCFSGTNNRPLSHLPDDNFFKKSILWLFLI